MSAEVIAIIAAIAYALFTIFGWFGLQSSTPKVATVVSLTSRTLVLWLAVWFTGGIPEFDWRAMYVFLLLGALQSVTSLLTFAGLQKIGTSRSQPLRNSYPFWSAVIAITFLHEHAGWLIGIGTLLVVVGVTLVSWKPDQAPPNYRWWHVFYSLGAGMLAGIAFPLRRYGLLITNEPVFFAAIIAVVSLVGATPYLIKSAETKREAWQLKSLFHFTLSGMFEALGALLSLVALGIGQVVIVSPIVATTPLWNLLIAAIFLRHVENINRRTITGTFAVVLGTVAIALGK